MKENKLLIKSNFLGTCFLCKMIYAQGEWVWWDKTKPSGEKTVHKGCWNPSKG